MFIKTILTSGFTVIVVSLYSVFALANEPVVYTFEGKKDPRLQATFSVMYKGTSDIKECTQQNPATATRKPMLAGKSYRITEENYRIEIPVYQQETDGQCGYQFRRIELVLRRQYDKELYSAHILLDTEQKVKPIYYGYKTGIAGGGGKPLTPGTLYTDKQYFRIATETNYFCRTRFFERFDSTDFSCFMQIRGGQGKNQFIKHNKYNRVSHPEFGVDKLKNETFQVNIMADDNGSKFYPSKRGVKAFNEKFRTLPKPYWQRLKDQIDKWF